MREPRIIPTSVPPACGAGIYMIHSAKLESRYIGSTVSLAKRLNEHRGRMLKGSWTYRLKDAIAVHRVLYFTVLEVCKPGDLEDRERFYIDRYQPDLNLASANRRGAFPDAYIVAEAERFAAVFHATLSDLAQQKLAAIKAAG